LPCVDPKVESAQQKTPPMRAFAQRRHHSRASVAHHEQLAIFSMNRAEPSVNVQVRLKYQDYLKNPVELGPGMHHRSARPHQAADTSAPGQPARTRTLGTIRLRGGRGGSLGPRGHAAGVMAGPLRLGPPCGWPRRPGGPARAGGRQASDPKTVGVRGHASGRRQHRAATEKPIITIYFQRADKELRAPPALLRDRQAAA